MTSGELEAYDARVVEQQRAAYEFVEKGLRDFIALNGSEDVALLRDYAIALLEQAQANYGDAAAKVACDAYDEVVAALGIEADPAEMADAGDYDPEGFARYQAGKAAAGDIEGFISAVAAEAEYRARLAANLTTSHNAERDHGKGVRFARVPTGVTTCGFCVVMASRGFSYASREAAGDVGARFNSYHRHCDCRVVAGVEGTTVEGYDPEWYDSVYRDAMRTAGCGPSDIDAIAKEINTRSPDWVYRKQPGKATYEKPRENLLKHERDGLDALLAKGFDVTALNEDNDAKSNMDFSINGQLWEMKNIGDGKHSIEDQMRRAFHKWEKAGERSPVRIVVTSFGMTRSEDDAINEITRRMDKYADEVLFVSSDGKTIKRLTKQ